MSEWPAVCPRCDHWMHVHAIPPGGTRPTCNVDDCDCPTGGATPANRFLACSSGPADGRRSTAVRLALDYHDHVTRGRTSRATLKELLTTATVIDDFLIGDGWEVNTDG